MKNNKSKNTSINQKENTSARVTSDYDDDNIPEIDTDLVDPLSEDDRPRRDGPGGN